MAVLLSAWMIVQTAVPDLSFGSEAAETIEQWSCALTEDSLLPAVRTALEKRKAYRKERFHIEGAYAEDYEKVLGLEDDDTKLYKLSFDSIAKASASELRADNSTLTASASEIPSALFDVYLKLDADGFDEDAGYYLSSGDEELILIAKNRKNRAQHLNFTLLDEEIALTIPSKKAILKEEDDFATGSNVTKIFDEETQEASSEAIATASEIRRDMTGSASVLPPAVVNGKAAVAITLPAEALIQQADRVSYSYETDSAWITATTARDAFEAPVSLEARELEDEEEAALSDILQQNARSFDGLKSFDIHFLSENGDETEPQDSVDVTIALKPGVLPEDVDADSMTVCHISEENAASAISLAAYAEEDSETSDETNAEFSFEELRADITGDAEAGYETRFTTETFSYFVLAYNKKNSNPPSLYAYLYDSDGKEISIGESDPISGSDAAAKKYDPFDLCANWLGGQGSANVSDKWLSIKTLVALIKDKTEGYSYLGAYTDSGMTDQFYWLYYKTSDKTWWVSTDSADTAPTAAPSASDTTCKEITENTELSKKAIYIKFQNNVISSELQDQVAEKGCFLAAMPEELASRLSSVTIQYKWYRSSDGEHFEQVSRKKTVSQKYNIETNTSGSMLYPSRDDCLKDGERLWYKAELYVDGKLCKEYGKRQVAYYPNIMNGSFEDPSVTLMGGNTSYDFPNGTEGLYWRTTADDKEIEIIHSGTQAGTNYNCSTAKDGDQWAELNAEARGALYQDVLVHPGSTLYWRFAYHYRNGNSEKMDMVIAPYSAVEKITTTTEYETLADQIQNGTSDYKAADGYYMTEGGHTAAEWKSFEGTYEVPDDIYVVRFLFISRSGTTVGNMLDDVYFSTTVPGPEAGYANVTAVEKVSGLSADDMQKLSMKVWLVDTSGNTVKDKNGDNAEKTVSFGTAEAEDDGSYSASVVFRNVVDDTEYTLKKALYIDGKDVPKIEETGGTYEHTTESYALLRNETQEKAGTGTDVDFTATHEQTDKIQVNYTDVFKRVNPVRIKIQNTINEKYDPFGTPSFIYEITNDDGTYKKVVMLDMNALTETSAEIALPAGTYTVKQIPVSRYVPDNNKDTETKALQAGDSYTFVFSNTIQQYEKCSHTVSKTNHIPKASS